MLAVNPIDIEVFSGMRGLSSRNLLAMKIFAREFPSAPIPQQPVAQLPWGHVLQLLQRVKNPAVRDFYIQQSGSAKLKTTFLPPSRPLTRTSLFQARNMPMNKKKRRFVPAYGSPME